MSRSGVPVGLGTKFEYDGEVTEIVSLSRVGNTFEYITADVRQQATRRFTIDEVMTSDRVRMIPTEPGPAHDDIEDVASVVLSAVDDDARKRALERAAHVREVLTGYRSGSAEAALPDEPRARYKSDVPLMARYQAKAEELGKGVRTIRDWVKRYGEHGEAGLVSQREVRSGLGSRTDDRFKETLLEVMAEFVDQSIPNRKLVRLMACARIEARYGKDVVKLPGRTTAYKILADLDRQHPLFRGSAKRNRDIAGRPKGVYGKLVPTRPGEYVLMDTTRSDVYAVDPDTMAWVNCEITVAMEWYSRAVCGLRVTPVSTKSIDGMCVFYQCMRPAPAGRDWPARALWPPVGVPRHVLVEVESLDPKSVCAAASPPIVPGTLVVDHGSIFISAHLNSVCQRLGISIQPARLRTPWDKGPVERFFRTLREGLLQTLPGYKGPDVFSRGLDVERDAWLYVDELEARIRKWIADEYHNHPHEGLRGLELEKLEMTPVEKWAEGIERGGYIEAPRDRYLPLEFLPIVKRTIQPAGIQWNHRIYKGEALCGRVGTKSPYRGMGGLWPIAYNPDDITKVYFRDPDASIPTWHILKWELADALNGPMSEDALKFQRVLARAEKRYINDEMAIAGFLERKNLGLGVSRAERRAVLRLTRQQSTLIGDIDAAMSMREKGFDEDGEGPSPVGGSAPGDPAAGFVDDLDEDEPDVDDFLEGVPSGSDFYSSALEVQ